LIFVATPLAGAYVVELERNLDERGFFARTWCRREFARHGLDVDIVQASISYNRRAGTLRGMHFAWPPSREGKLVRCERGAIFDAIIDLRPSSPTFARHFAQELNEDNRLALYIPPGFAHGFQTLADDTEVLYMMTDFYRPELAGGVRFDDPEFAIRWPRPVSVITERDRTYPAFDRHAHVCQYLERTESPLG
jgi:dTDP-4-dehydrorhamnose 3,5-epimerase